MAQSPIRLPTRDVFSNVQELPDSAEMEKYLFNDIGGTELINLVRNDSVSGITFNYSIISDLASNDMLFDPAFLLINKSKYQSEFDRFGIKLSTRIPEENYFESNTTPPSVNVGTNAYYDESTQSLIIEFENTGPEEFVEIEVEVPGSGKIYSMRENDY